MIDTLPTDLLAGPLPPRLDAVERIAVLRANALGDLLISMPALEALRADERTRGVRVVVLSAYDEPSIVREGLALGAVDWLVKSKVTPPELSRYVRRWLAAA